MSYEGMSMCQQWPLQELKEEQQRQCIVWKVDTLEVCSIVYLNSLSSFKCTWNCRRIPSLLDNIRKRLALLLSLSLFDDFYFKRLAFHFQLKCSIQYMLHIYVHLGPSSNFNRKVCEYNASAKPTKVEHRESLKSWSRDERSQRTVCVKFAKTEIFTIFRTTTYVHTLIRSRCVIISNSYQPSFSKLQHINVHRRKNVQFINHVKYLVNYIVNQWSTNKSSDRRRCHTYFRQCPPWLR